ncbi:MAG: hypothetical protein LAP87_28895 [Acidobacteriia bacterium]|nr:hypothetical protein [Terriglobia bacterium]
MPLLYFLLVARGQPKARFTLVPMCLVALLRASYVAPGMGWTRPVIGAAAEIAIVSLVLVRVRRGRRAGGQDGDVLERLRAACLEVVRIPVAANVLATELAFFWYGLCSWRAKPHAPAGARVFPVYERSSAGLFFAAAAGMGVVEALVAHAIVMRWSQAAAWVLSGLSIYGTVWLIALSRSFWLRPCYLQNGELVLRNGLLWSLRVPLHQIASMSPARGERADLSMPPATDGNLRLEFSSPVTVRKLYGFEWRVRSVAVSVDDPEALLQCFR